MRSADVLLTLSVLCIGLSLIGHLWEHGEDAMEQEGYSDGLLDGSEPALYITVTPPRKPHLEHVGSVLHVKGEDDIEGWYHIVGVKLPDKYVLERCDPPEAGGD